MIVFSFIGLAALGSLARVVITRQLNTSRFPIGTLMVNIIGAFLLGIIASDSNTTVLLFGTGALGSMTTFSTLSQEAVNLGSDKVRKAVVYILVSLGAGVGAAWLGLLV